MLAHNACVEYNKCMQYTVRNVFPALDAVLRRLARERGMSLNEVTLEALARGVGLSEQWRQRDLSDIGGSWKEDASFESALKAQDTIDPELWR